MQNNQFIKKYGWPIAIGAGVLFLFGGKNSAAKSLQTASDELKNTPGGQSYTLTSYANLADGLQNAMTDVGTDEARIYSIFEKMKTAKDLLLLIKAFGIREYYNFGIREGKYNLAQWLTTELSESEIEKINKILRGNNINFTF